MQSLFFINLNYQFTDKWYFLCWEGRKTQSTILIMQNCVKLKLYPKGHQSIKIRMLPWTAWTLTRLESWPSGPSAMSKRLMLPTAEMDQNKRREPVIVKWGISETKLLSIFDSRFPISSVWRRFITFLFLFDWNCHLFAGVFYSIVPRNIHFQPRQHAFVCLGVIGFNFSLLGKNNNFWNNTL